jgi:hypothetical protein
LFSGPSFGENEGIMWISDFMYFFFIRGRIDDNPDSSPFRAV